MALIDEHGPIWVVSLLLGHEDFSAEQREALRRCHVSSQRQELELVRADADGHDLSLFPNARAATVIRVSALLDQQREKLRHGAEKRHGYLLDRLFRQRGEDVGKLVPRDVLVPSRRAFREDAGVERETEIRQAERLLRQLVADVDDARFLARETANGALYLAAHGSLESLAQVRVEAVLKVRKRGTRERLRHHTAGRVKREAVATEQERHQPMPALETAREAAASTSVCNWPTPIAVSM